MDAQIRNCRIKAWSSWYLVISTLVNIWTAGRLSARALFTWLTPAAFLPTLVVGPALKVAFFGIVIRYSGRDIQQGIAGLVLFSAAVSGLYGGLMIVAGDRWQGTLEPVIRTPMSTGMRLFSRFFPIAGYGMITSLVLTLTAVLLQVFPFRAELLMMLCILAAASAASTAALGILIGTFGLLVRDAFVWASVFFLILQVTSGAIVPRTELPSFFRLVSTCFPLSHSVQAGQTLILDSTRYSVWLVAIVWEVGIAATLLVLATNMHRRLEQTSARLGRLAFE